MNCVRLQCSTGRQAGTGHKQESHELSRPAKTKQPSKVLFAQRLRPSPKMSR